MILPIVFAIDIFSFAITTLVRILLAKPCAKHGPLTTDILIFFNPFLLKIFFNFTDRVFI